MNEHAVHNTSYGPFMVPINYSVWAIKPCTNDGFENATAKM